MIDKQTGKLIARIAENLPDMESEVMQNWIDKPTELQSFLLGLNPPKPQPTPRFVFERNEHGHVVLTFTGLDLTGADEIERLETARYRVGDYAKSCLLSTREDSYDTHHRLVAGQVYRVALMPGVELEQDRTTANLRSRGMKHYSYGKPLGGLIPRVREVLSDEQMKELGIFYVAALHDPIADSDGDPDVLDAYRFDDGRWVNTCWGDPDLQWNDDGAFVFPVSAK